jgi:hypothetical protein
MFKVNSVYEINKRYLCAYKNEIDMYRPIPNRQEKINNTQLLIILKEVL